MSRKRKIFKDTEDPESLKDKGNSSFLARDYPSAIRYYSEAIKISPNISILYSNRSRCFYMIKDFSNALQDSFKSFQLDNLNLKAHMLYVRCLANISKQSLELDSALEALNHCQNTYYIASSNNEPEYATACSGLETKLKALIYLKNIEKKNYKISRLKHYYKDSVRGERLKKIFEKHLQETKLKEVSESFICPISMEVFTEPLITEHGNTYDIESLKSHFSKVGLTDPIARVGINPHMIYKNLAVAQAVKWMKAKEPWKNYSDSPISSLDLDF